jgi:hypothetical protein
MTEEYTYVDTWDGILDTANKVEYESIGTLTEELEIHGVVYDSIMWEIHKAIKEGTLEDVGDVINALREWTEEYEGGIQ